MQSLEERLGSAVLAQQAGRLQEAESVYRAVLQEQPDNPDVLHLLGLAAHQAGRHDEAIDLIRKALGVHGLYPLFHSNLSAVYLTVGKLIEAALHARESIRLKPDLPDAHANLGHALLRQGLLDEAAAAFTEALRLDRKNIDTRCNLGNIFVRRGRLQEAVAILSEAVRLAPANPKAQNALGEALSVAGAADKGVPYFREAIRLKPNYHEAWNNMGGALGAMHQHDEAIRCFREALRIEPNYVPARNNLAFSLEALGKVKEAATELEQTLRLDPNDARAYCMLGRYESYGHFRFSDEQVQRLRRLVQRRDLPQPDYNRLHQALAFHYDKVGPPDEAFYHCRLAKEYRRETDLQRGSFYDPRAQEHYVDRSIATCTPAWFDRVKTFGNDTELPIFIVGMMRSGTTLAEQMLASHPAVKGAGELLDMDALVNTLPQRMRLSVNYPDCLAWLDAATAAQLAEEYLKTLRTVGGSARRVVDKLPFNFLRLGLIAALFPKARIIHCVRNAADTCCSCFFQYFASPHPFTYDLRHLGHYYREYERLMEHWKRVLPVPIFELPYEELTAQPETWGRRMVEFCGLEWDERCLQFYQTERVVRTVSSLQVRQGIYRSSVGRWRRYEKHLQPLLEALGRYAPTEPGTTSETSR